jgi:hypothetical protein
LKEIASRTRKFTTPPSPIETSWRTTSAMRRSRTVLAAVSTAPRAAASQDSELTPITSVTRYTLLAIKCSFPWFVGQESYHRGTLDGEPVEKPVLIRQHLESAPPGTLASWLDARGLAYEVDRSWLGGPLPDPGDYAFVASLGHERGANDTDEAAVTAERELLGLAVAREVPVLGLCYGGQVLAAVLGGHVGPAPLAMMRPARPGLSAAQAVGGGFDMISTRLPDGSRTNERGASHAFEPGRASKPSSRRTSSVRS